MGSLKSFRQSISEPVCVTMGAHNVIQRNKKNPQWLLDGVNTFSFARHLEVSFRRWHSRLNARFLSCRHFSRFLTLRAEVAEEMHAEIVARLSG